MIVVILLIVGFFVYQNYYNEKSQTKNQTSQTQDTENTQNETTDQPLMTVTSPNKEEIWQIGTNHTIKYAVSANMPSGAICIDAYLVNKNGGKIALNLGNYIGIAKEEGLQFQLGINYSEDIIPGSYKIELDSYSCAGMNNTFIASVTGNGLITVTANPNFIKPTITQISPNQGGGGDVITTYGSNLSSVVGIIFYPNGNGTSFTDNGYTAFASIVSKDQNHVSFKLNSEYYGTNDIGLYQMEVISPTGNSNPLNFTISSK